MPRRDLVRIVLVGDGEEEACPSKEMSLIIVMSTDGVGKSSIITSLIKESFVSNVS